MKEVFDKYPFISDVWATFERLMLENKKLVDENWSLRWENRELREELDKEQLRKELQ